MKSRLRSDEIDAMHACMQIHGDNNENTDGHINLLFKMRVRETFRLAISQITYLSDTAVYSVHRFRLDSVHIRRSSGLAAFHANRM